MPEHDKLLSKAKKALSSGENFIAYDLAEKIKAKEVSPQRIWIMALALARSGSLRRAYELANMLPDTDDIEIIGFKSRIFKDLALAQYDSHCRRHFFFEAARRSEDIFQKKKSWYNGINAASCLHMAGETKRAKNLIREHILPLCEQEKTKDMWLEATLGECHLLLRDFKKASYHYANASRMALDSGAFGDFSSTLRQLKMLLTTYSADCADFLEHIPLPSICVFSGHRIDSYDRLTPRFPPSAESQVRNQIISIVRQNKITLGYASCADGGDIIFLESVLTSGGYVWVAPPFPLESSIKTLVSTPTWKRRLKSILRNPHTRIIEPECDLAGVNDEIAYDFTNRYILGLAHLKSTALNLPIRGLAVWDRVTPLKTGNTSCVIQLWNASNLKYDIITPIKE